MCRHLVLVCYANGPASGRVAALGAVTVTAKRAFVEHSLFNKNRIAEILSPRYSVHLYIFIVPMLKVHLAIQHIF